MNKFDWIALGVLFLTLIADIFTYIFFLAPSNNAHGEANPFKVLFGENIMLLVVIPISLIVAIGFYHILKHYENDNFKKTAVYLFMANVVYSKIFASIGNVYASLATPEPIEPATYLLVSYFITIIIIFISPLLFNLAYFWLANKSQQNTQVSNEEVK